MLKLIKRCYRIFRGAVSTAVMISVAPTFLVIHTGFRVISIALPCKHGYTLDDFVWGMYQKLVLFFFEHVTGVEIILSGKIPKEKENVIFICNHQCTVDWVVTDMVAERQNMIGNLRYVFKDALKYMPLYGYVFGVHGGVFVTRDGSYNENNMKKVLTKLQCSNALTYFVIFPEGTRFSNKRTNVLAKSQSYAVSNNLRPLNQVLTPRIKAFHCALNCLQGYASALYDVTIIYEERTEPVKHERYPAPNMWKFLLSPSPRIYVRFDRIPLTDIPRNPSQLTLSWLHSRFERKDALITRHFEIPREVETKNAAGRIATSKRDGKELIADEEDFKNGSLSTISLSKTLPSTLFLAGLTAGLLATRYGRYIYFSSLLGGSVLTIAYSKVFF